MNAEELKRVEAIKERPWDGGSPYANIEWLAEQDGGGVSAPALSILSMGWGVQTWTIAAMMALEEMPRADYIVFADTRHEGQATYEFIRQWEPWLGEHGLSVVTVQAKHTDPVQRWESETEGVMMPAFTTDRITGKPGQMGRQCTRTWKINPIRQFGRGQLARRGIKLSPGIVEQWMGISLDEWHRMKDSDVQYIIHRYPLVDMRMRRSDCIAWLESHGLPVPPKSACTFCPYRSAVQYKEMKRVGGPDWAEAVAVDEEIRNKRKKMTLYVHPARKPLSEAVSIPEDFGAKQLGLEDAPCDSGHCFV